MDTCAGGGRSVVVRAVAPLAGVLVVPADADLLQVCREADLDLAAIGLLDLDLPRRAVAVVALHAHGLAAADQLDRCDLGPIGIRPGGLLIRVASHGLGESHASGAESEDHRSTDK